LTEIKNAKHFLEPKRKTAKIFHKQKTACSHLSVFHL